MQKRLLFLTGNPGIGKTTVLLRASDVLKSKGYRVGGMISREVRSSGIRIGFEILDLNSSECGWLSHVNQKEGPAVGKYRVNLTDLNGIGVNAILAAVKESDVVVIDEIGPMELFSSKFHEAVKTVFDSRKLVIGVVHQKVKNKLVAEAKNREDAEVLMVTMTNRDKLHEALVKKALEFLE